MTTVIRGGGGSFGRMSSSTVTSIDSSSYNMSMSSSNDSQRRSAPTGKKGSEASKVEVGEARAALLEAISSRDEEKVIAAVQKVITHMTLGLDMSPLYSSMIMAINTTSIAQKKLVYMFLCEYGKRHADMALLAINTLAKDCSDSNPVIRGLAVRTVGSFGLPSLLEYTTGLVRKAIEDPNAYVRKNAVFSAAKLLPIMPEEEALRMMNSIASLVTDTDACVALNALAALRENNPAYKPPMGVVANLLGSMRRMDEWQQCALLEWLTTIAPEASDDDALMILNTLDERLQDNNSGIVLAVVALFLKLTERSPEMQNSVIERVRAPLLLLVATAMTPELEYPVLCHLKLFLSRIPNLLEKDFRHLFLRPSDPTYLKTLKLEILTAIATERNAAPILDELAANAMDLDAVCSREALIAMGNIALKIPQTLKSVVEHLCGLLDLGVRPITLSVISVFKDLLRKFDVIAENVLPRMHHVLEFVEDDAAAKSAIVWAFGAFPNVVPEAPYIIESFVDHWKQQPTSVRIELLSASVKMLLARPPEGAPAAGKALAHAAADRSSVELRDMAALYYRLLEKDPSTAAAARAVVVDSAAPVASYVEDESSGLQEKLFGELNTLSVPYAKPSAERPKFVPRPDNGSDYATMDSEVGDGYEGEEGEDSGAASGTPLMLLENPSLDAKSFQKMWGELPAACQKEGTLNIGLSVDEFVPQIKANKIELACIAAGIVKGTAKVYAYSQLAQSKEHLLVELLIDQKSAAVKATFKSTNSEFVLEWARLVCANYLGFN